MTSDDIQAPPSPFSYMMGVAIGGERLRRLPRPQAVPVMGLDENGKQGERGVFDEMMR